MDIRIKNYYCMIAGVLAILFAITHAWNGQSAVLPTLLVNDISLDTQVTFTYVWHIITAENLVFGIVFIILSFLSEKAKIRFAAWMIVSLLLVRLMVILSVTAYYDVSALTNTLIDSFAILIYAAFIILGTRIKKE
ncbi:hypothetical protein J40TS1_31330 [Paenibacillus montaniterrae]|uniref:DUF4345 domain-containing protein n=1 Tax=Paenibacillus montaniterrae TaxID=429341 RepID=A0A919YSB8_9BACL|nr:hypothetical protein [Paenibacillus montaniterrae]GIP17491.1 hypothetical protein J40TS1_31330 [Paenibacillus montaniterrae]